MRCGLRSWIVTGVTVWLAAATAQCARAALTSEVRELNGVPVLFVNGKLTSQVLAAPYRDPQRNGIADFNDFRAAGVTIYNLYLRFAWTGPQTYDFSGVDRKLDAYLAIDKSVLFLPRILLTPGTWFAKQFPDEISQRDDGTPAGMFRSQNAGNNPSFSSSAYRELSHQAMTAFIHHLEDKYGDHMVGYQVGNGFGGEWLPFNSFWEARPGEAPPQKFGVEDYSPAARTAFRKWLRDKYQTDAALQAAWHDPAVTLAAATPPNEVERYSTTRGIFFDPAVSSRCPDWFSFYNDSVASVLVENAHWAKGLTGRKKIVGSFYGYLWCNFPNLSAVHSGQLGLTKVLNCPDVDFLCSPYTYDNKGIGGPNNSQTLPEAAALHGKLYFNEVDTETHLQQRQWRWGNSLHNPQNFAETKGLLVRDYAYSFTKGNGLWWTDLMGGDYHDEAIIKLLGQLKQIDERMLESDKRSTADIAVVLDESAFTYTGDGEPLWNALLTAQKQWEFAFLGAPWEPQLLSDIANPKLHDYKLYIFLNTFQVTPQQRAAIHAKLKKNGATALWVYAPGYIDGQKCDVNNMTALTGIKLAEDRAAGELHVDPLPQGTGNSHRLAAAVVPYGTDVRVNDIIRYYDHQVYLKDPRDPSLVRDLPGFRVAPRFYVDDPQAETLGVLAGLERPGLAKKTQAGWTSIYSAAPILPAALLREIAREAGCQIYDDGGDVVVANASSLSIYSPNGGDRLVRLPNKSKVTDLLEDKVIADSVSEFPLKFAANESVLLKIDEIVPATTRSPAAELPLFRSIHANADVEPTADPGSPFWKDIAGVTMDRSVLGPPVPELRADVRSRWTAQNIYVLFAGHYELLSLNAHPDTAHETPHLWEKDVFEFYLGGDREHPNRYREFQVSPQGEFLDNDIDSTVRRPGLNGEEAWNSGMQVQARIDEQAKIWYGELKIPWSAVASRAPQVGDELPTNCFRQDNLRQPDASGHPRAFLAWRPPGVWNPHHPEKFGVLRLVDGP
jgi:Beta-galactosidase